jgi:two-component system response regulator AlgR
MPGMDGIDVARALAARPADPMVIFVTAFDNFAVAAFDVAAIDYLMKPVQPARLSQAIERAREHPRRVADGITAEPRYVEEFWVPELHGLVRIAAGQIDRITAERDYMRLHVGSRSWLIHRTIAKLEEELDPEMFVRVHRSVILRRDTIIGLHRDEAGHWNARMNDGAEQRIGRSYADMVRRMTGRG